VWATSSGGLWLGDEVLTRTAAGKVVCTVRLVTATAVSGLARAVPQATSFGTALTGGAAGLAAALGDLVKSGAQWGNQLKQLNVMTAGPDLPKSARVADFSCPHPLLICRPGRC
jgi:hypothetical protein